MVFTFKLSQPLKCSAKLQGMAFFSHFINFSGNNAWMCKHIYMADISE